MKLVLIYDKLIRNDTTGIYCEAALRALGVDLVHFAPLYQRESALAIRSWSELPPADLYLQIDDDIAYLPPGFPRASAYWCIDVHRMNHMFGGSITRWQKMQRFDRVFSAQRDMSQRLGIPWLPLAYDPASIHPLTPTEKCFDWCFVGNIQDQRRARALEQLKARIPNAFIGNAYGPRMNLLYNQSRLVLNLSIGNDVNMRFFEAQGSGTPLLSNRVHNGEDELFDGMLYVDSLDELPTRVALLLQNPDQLHAAGQRQLQRVRQDHTYIARMQQLLKLCQYQM